MDWNTIKEISEAIGTVLAALTICLITFRKQMDNYIVKKKEDISKKVINQSDVDIKIINKMEQTKELINADRILVYDFHNGEHYANGRSALKMSVSYEVVRYGIEHLQYTLQGIPLSIMPNLISALLEKGEFNVHNIEDFSKMQPEYSICSRLNMKSFYNVIIRGKNNEPVGFVSVHFSNVTDNVDYEAINRLSWFVEEEIQSLAN